jgi:hypothetical protein
VGELGAVGRVADGARQDGYSLVGVVALDQGLVVVEDGVDAPHRVVLQPPIGVDPGAEAGDVRAALELGGDPAVLHIGDQEPGRIGPDVGDGDAHFSVRSAC